VGKKRPGRDADPSPLSSIVVMKEYSYTSTLLVSRTACTEPQCLYKCDLYLYFKVSTVRAPRNQHIVLTASSAYSTQCLQHIVLTASSAYST